MLAHEQTVSLLFLSVGFIRFNMGVIHYPLLNTDKVPIVTHVLDSYIKYKHVQLLGQVTGTIFYLLEVILVYLAYVSI